jgi:ribose/xylose/arabinose/galactoside ABC-type transport system permease subunit
MWDKYVGLVNTAIEEMNFQGFIVFLTLFFVPIIALAVGILLGLIIVITEFPKFLIILGIAVPAYMVIVTVVWINQHKTPKKPVDVIKYKNPDDHIKVVDSDYDPTTYPREF